MSVGPCSGGAVIPSVTSLKPCQTGLHRRNRRALLRRGRPSSVWYSGEVRGSARQSPLHYCCTAPHPVSLLLPLQAGQTRQAAGSQPAAHTQAPSGPTRLSQPAHRTGPDRANRWSKPTRPCHHRLSFCPDATAASRCLLPTKRPHRISPLVYPPLLPRRTHRHTQKHFSPLPTATAAASSPFPPAFAPSQPPSSSV